MCRNISKRVIQIICFFIEIALVTTSLVYLTLQLQPCESKWEYIERAVTCYAVYQIIVILILNNLNDIRKDSYLALLSNYKCLDLYFRTRKEFVKNTISKNIDYQLKYSTLNDSDIRQEYKILKDCMENQLENEVAYKIILFEHLSEEATLQWKYSFLLRLVKS